MLWRMTHDNSESLMRERKTQFYSTSENACVISVSEMS